MNNTTFEGVILDINSRFSNLTWLDKCYPRAYEFLQQLTPSKTIKVPKCKGNGNNYTNVLPNDKFKAYSFAFATSTEKSLDVLNVNFNRISKTRNVAFIFWFNVQKVNICIEDLRHEIINSLVGCKYISSTIEISDEVATQLFKPFDISESETQYLMYPYGGIRLDFTVTWGENYCTN